MRFSALDWRRGGRALCSVLEVVLLSALILLTRCANFENVFVGGKIYFVDGDCYARMTRARLVAQHPGLVVRHHDFENYPAGTSPHTTAPLDYLIVGLAGLLSLGRAQPLDLAGAIISPLLALAGGWFLWWWTRRMRFRYRWAALAMFALSPILAHGTALGRPDHQALLIFFLLVALAAEGSLQIAPTRGWSVVSGLSWGMALWVSLYEPLLLLAALAVQPRRLWARPRRVGWFVFGGILIAAAAIERRWPQLPDPALRFFFFNWSATIGELRPLGLTSVLWWQWFGAFVVVAPPLIFWAARRKVVSRTFLFLLCLTFLGTLWQARFGYFLALVFVLMLPALLSLVRQGWLVALVVSLALLPCLQHWDETFWPNEKQLNDYLEARAEAVSWREAADALPRDRLAPFLAPWWLSASVTYWSGQPAIAGSSHESLAGIIASARFFLATQPNDARQILRERGVQWVLAYDAERVAENSAEILGLKPFPHAFCFVLDRTPSLAPHFLNLRGQNSVCKLYQCRD